jgi:hypothetical protein
MEIKELSIEQKLGIIQCKLKAKKNKFNKFGKYHYRNLESIYESVKPLLSEYSCYLVIDNEIELIGETLFRKSIASIGCCDSHGIIKVHTYTQEAFNKPGMSPEQCSGSTASYGDKYVLNKLFCLDDSDGDQSHADPDSDINSTLKASSGKPEDYKPKFGKFAGTPLKEMDKNDLKNFCQWLSKQPDLGDMQKELLENAREYLGGAK